ncbi:MAG: FAD-dependent oxidoreductase [Pseudomonadota bacterium]
MDQRAIVVGGGIGGLTAALCLARTGWQVQVFEQSPAFGEAGAGIQLSPNASRVLHGLGLQPALERRAFLPQETQVRAWHSGRVISRTPLGESAKTRYGTPYYHVHRGDLLRVLLDAAEGEAGIDLRTGCRVEGFVQSAAEVTTVADGEPQAAELLLGADGIKSEIRATLFGAEAPRFTGNLAWRALVPADRLPDGLIAPATTVWWGPGKHFVHYFVRGGELVNCVCVVEKNGWEVEDWTTRGEPDELRADFAGWHDIVQRLIDAADPNSLYKWALFDRAPMVSWGWGRVTLLGDACHPTLPFLAQGAAMAIEDAAVLAGCLSRGAGVPAALVRYARLRQERTARIQRGSRRNARVFHLAGIAAWVRDRAAASAGGRVLDGIYRYDAWKAAEDTQ